MPQPIMSTTQMRAYQILQLMEVQLITPAVAVFVHQQFEAPLNVCAFLREEIINGLDIPI
jgi:hypothetical protein